MTDTSHLDTTPLTEDPLFIPKDTKVFMLGDWVDGGLRNQGTRDIENARLNIPFWEKFGYSVIKQQKSFGAPDMFQEAIRRYKFEINGIGFDLDSRAPGLYRDKLDSDGTSLFDTKFNELQELMTQGGVVTDYRVPATFVFDAANFIDHMRMWEKVKALKNDKGVLIINPHNNLVRDITAKVYRYGIVGIGNKARHQVWWGHAHRLINYASRMAELRSMVHIDYVRYMAEDIPLEGAGNPFKLTRPSEDGQTRLTSLNTIGRFRPAYDPYAPAYFITPKKARQLYKKYKGSMLQPFWSYSIVPIEIKRELNNVGIDFNQGYAGINDIYDNS